MDTQPTTTAPKTAVITLHSGNSTMTLLATRKADGSAVTEQHADMTTAKAHLVALAKKAETLGWQRAQGAGLKAKPDAFSKLPAPPAAVRAPKVGA